MTPGDPTGPGDDVLSSGAGLEVEQSLRLERDGLERDIARYRLWLYLLGVVVTTAIWAIQEVQRPGLGTWMPTLYFAACAIYAAGLRLYVERSREAGRIGLVSLVLDLVGAVALYPLFIALATPEASAHGAPFPVYLVSPGLFTVLLINLLRYDTVTAITGGLVAAALFVYVSFFVVTPHVAQVPVVALLAFTGVIGASAARRARLGLERFARLQLLRRYLSPTAVERVMRDDPDAAMSLGGELKTLTLMATDLRGFTALSEKLAPAEVVRQLNGYHTAVLGPTARHGGVLDKYIGDGSLVVFGLEGSPDRGAAAAVACARDMLAALAVHNQARAQEGHAPLKMGIGIHTGPVISGNVGSPSLRLDFTVIGDAVNTASRLEGLTKEQGTPVLVSADTVACLPSAADLRPLAALSIRGRESPLEVFALADVGATPST